MQKGRRAGVAGVVIAALALLTAGPPAVASGAPRSQPAGDDIPVVGTFSYPPFMLGTKAETIRAAVHAVRRVPGGTALYYSVGVPAGESWSANSFLPVPSPGSGYRSVDLAEVGLVDTEGLRFYQPMLGPDGCLCPDVSELGFEGGKLHVGWALMPPLPATVQTVSVVFGYGQQVQNVPVGERALEPTAPMPMVLGEGWPVLPDEAAIAAVVDPPRFARPLIRHVADLDRRVTTNEQPGQVDEDLAADVLFAVNSATLTPAAEATIAQVAARVKERAMGEVTVIGHTDSTGGPELNARLSLDRARAVQAALQPGVGPGVTLTATGKGEKEPVADNTTDEGRAQNRRVTVTYRVPEGS